MQKQLPILCTKYSRNMQSARFCKSCIELLFLEWWIRKKQLLLIWKREVCFLRYFYDGTRYSYWGILEVGKRRDWFSLKITVLANIKYSYEIDKLMLELNWIGIDTVSPKEITILRRHNERNERSPVDWRVKFDPSWLSMAGNESDSSHFELGRDAVALLDHELISSLCPSEMEA